MDGNNDNIFEAGTSRPESGITNVEPVRPANVGGVEGRIDPAFARAIQGDGSASGLVSDGANGDATSGTPGPELRTGRGRHPKNCGCAKCAAKAAGEPAPSGSVTDKTQTARNVRATFIERLLYSIHLGLAGIASCPELKLEPDDAKELGAAVAGVMALHKIKMTQSQEAYAILFEACAKVYPPMAISVYLRKKAEAEGKGRVLKFAPTKAAPAQTPEPQPAPQPAAAKSVIAPSLTPFDPLNIGIGDGPQKPN